MKIKYIVYEVTEKWIETDEGGKILTTLSEMDRFDTEDRVRYYINDLLKTDKKRQLTYLKVFYN
jgi:hypothetical protein